MARHRIDDKPLSEPMLTLFTNPYNAALRADELSNPAIPFNMKTILFSIGIPILSHTPHCVEGVRIMFMNHPWAIHVW